MASPGSTTYPNSVLPDGPRRSFWARESRPVKQGVKTGIAGLIAYAIYIIFRLPEGYWAVITALVVTQANLGASWKAALYRTAGSTVGALSAALLTPVIGIGPVRTGVILFLLAALFTYLTTLHPSFSAAAFTAALVLLLGVRLEPWHLAWLRVLYTVMGAVIAFLVGVLLWPVRARESLPGKIAEFLEACGQLYRAVTSAALREKCNPAEFEPLHAALSDEWNAITTALDEARTEPSFNRFDDEGYAALLEELDHLRQRLMAMCRDSSLSSHAGVLSTLVPELEPLTEWTPQALFGLATAVRSQLKEFDLGPLDHAEEDVDRRLQQLRDTRATSPFSLDRMLPFWSFLFNLKEIVSSVRRLNAKLERFG
jgi:uncharacterized membrane protein YccC